MDNELLSQLTTVNSEIAQVEAEISKKIAAQQKRLSTLREQDAELRGAIMQAMESNGLKKVENDVMAITYVAPTTRMTVDSAKLKKESPELYAKYAKTSDVKASIRIKIK